MNYNEIVEGLKSLSVSQLKTLMEAVKEQYKVASYVAEEEAKETGSSKYKINDIVKAVIGTGDKKEFVTGMVVNKTANGLTLQIAGRERNLFRKFAFIVELVESGKEQVNIAQQEVDPMDLYEGAIVTFCITGKTHAGMITRIGDKSCSVKYMFGGKERTIARPYNTILELHDSKKADDFSVAV